MSTPTTKPGNLPGRLRRWQIPVLHWRPGVAVIAVGFALAFDPLVVVGVAVLVVAVGLHYLRKPATKRGDPIGCAAERGCEQPVKATRFLAEPPDMTFGAVQ